MQPTHKKHYTLAAAIIIAAILLSPLPAASSESYSTKTITYTGYIQQPQPTTTPTPTPTPSPTASPTPTPTSTPPPINTQTLKGLSGYPTSTNQVANIIAVMQENNLNLFRMSFNPTWMSGPHPYHPEYIQYFLDHTPSNWVIIVDRNHIYPPTEAGASTFRDNINTARNSILQVAAAWPNNPRVWIELSNEYISTDFHTIFQGLIDDVRDAGYTNPLVIDKWNTAWSSAVFNDPYDSVYVGMHFYFNTWSVSGAISQMNNALRLGLKLVNTEVGADYNEANSFTTSTVTELNNFLEQCAELGVGNTVWMNENLNNWQTYQQLGINFP